jgi:hypothetical protein
MASVHRVANVLHSGQVRLSVANSSENANDRFAPEAAIRQSVVMEFRPTLLLEKRLN